MQLTGRYAGVGVAATAAGRQVPFRLLAPEKTTANLVALAAETKRWRGAVQRYWDLAGRRELDPAVARRAQFGEEVLFTVSGNVQLGVCCPLIAQADDGRVLGAANYGFTPPTGAYLHLQVIDPEHLPGSPGKDQLRGVGTALVAAISRDVLARGATELGLHPLDSKAAEFWRGRGFVDCGLGRMCIRTREGIEQLRDGCHVLPACTPDGECLLCGTMRATQQVRLPDYRAGEPTGATVAPG